MNATLLATPSVPVAGIEPLDVTVIRQARRWAEAGETLWLCTVLSTFGSAPREPGAMLAARADGAHAGSLSGGCVEENFLARLSAGEFDQPVTVVRYGGSDQQGVRLPCDGHMEILVERLPPARAATVLPVLADALEGRGAVVRHVCLRTGASDFAASRPGPAVRRDSHEDSHQDRPRVSLRVGPALRLIIAGISPVSHACAAFARGLGFEVIVCDPRFEQLRGFDVPGVRVQPVMPALYIASGHCHAATAVVALTHDPRIDDLAMMEAVRTDAFYIGVMGSQRTSEARARRLKRSGGLNDSELARLHMPIGLNLGSKTPAEIALAVMADILRVHRGRARDQL